MAGRLRRAKCWEVGIIATMYGSRGFLIAMLCLGLSPAVAETVYRTVDEDGSVRYSDHPVPGAEAVELPEVPTLELLPPGTRPTPRRGPPPAPTQATSPIYKSLVITQPAQDSAGWYTSGQLSVSVDLQPTLQAGHILVVYLDGVRAASGSGPTFQLANVYRGTHRVEAAVYAGALELLRSPPVSFHVLKHGVNSPQRQGNSPPPAQPQGATPSRRSN